MAKSTQELRQQLTRTEPMGSFAPCHRCRMPLPVTDGEFVSLPRHRVQFYHRKCVPPVLRKQGMAGSRPVPPVSSRANPVMLVEVGSHLPRYMPLAHSPNETVTDWMVDGEV